MFFRTSSVATRGGQPWCLSHDFWSLLIILRVTIWTISTKINRNAHQEKKKHPRNICISNERFCGTVSAESNLWHRGFPPLNALSSFVWTCAHLPEPFREKNETVFFFFLNASSFVDHLHVVIGPFVYLRDHHAIWQRYRGLLSRGTAEERLFLFCIY